MGCHEKALLRMDARLREAVTDPSSPWAGHVDALLEQRYQSTDLATEWDAESWGFDPDRWCEPERAEMDRLAR